MMYIYTHIYDTCVCNDVYVCICIYIHSHIYMYMCIYVGEIINLTADHKREEERGLGGGDDRGGIDSVT